MKKIIFLLSLIFSVSYGADNIVESCVIRDSDTYFPIGDERGKSVLTKFEVNRDCNITKTVQGPCLEWEVKKERYSLKMSDYDVYRSSNNEGAIGSLFGMIGAYDQIEHLWSGWKGYCESGTKTDFAWAADPMYWASMAMSMAMSAGGGANGTTGGVDGGKLIDTSLKNAADSAQTGLISIAKKVGIENMSKNAARCAIASGVDFAKGLFDYMSDKHEDPCDPIDEFCGSTEEQTQESDIITLDRTQYEDIINDNPEFADYIIILSEQDDILTIRYKKPNEMENSENMNQEELKKMQEKLKTTTFMINSAVTATKLASCMATADENTGRSTFGDNVGSAADHDAGRFSAKDGISTAVSMFPAEWLPYGGLLKAGLQVAIEVAMSFKDIDTCHNKEDATQAGSRHEKTQESLPYDLCHLVDAYCVEKDLLGSGCALDGFDYCCYDQILTKVLVEQLKAQLGRDWAHCTGITLRDLNYVSFRQCTNAEMQNGFDGSKKVGIYNPQGSFQYINKCVDLTEFKDFLQAQIGEEIDMSDFESMFSDMKANVN